MNATKAPPAASVSSVRPRKTASATPASVRAPRRPTAKPAVPAAASSASQAPQVSAPAAQPAKAPAPASATVLKAPKVNKAPKPVKAPKPEKAVKPSKVDANKPAKVKLVRDTFTFPEGEYTQLAALKKRALGLGVEAKKGELVRVGLALLSAASDDALRTALNQLVRLKTGRPKQ